MLPIALGIGPQEVGVVAVLLLVLFGAKRLPEIGRSLAEGIHEFKKASRKAREDDESSAEDKTGPAS